MSPFIERLGWVLIHSLWQLALLAAVAWVVQRSMRRTSAAARYAVLLGLLGLVVVAPVITWSVLPTQAAIPLAERSDPVPVRPSEPAPKIEAVAPALAPTPVTVELTPPITAVTPVPLEPVVPAKAPEPLKPSWSQWAQQSITPWLSTIVWGWSLGVLAFAIRPLWSWFTVRQLRTQGVLPVPEAVQAALAQTARRLGVTQAVSILQSTIVQVPIVAGYLKPVILLPASIVTGLPASQLEAILAHELAHIRRHDYLANLIQTLVETVFFYHPAVWWLSHQIRCERENCCDDIAVAMLGNRLDYSRALLAVEELRGTPTTLAIGASGGSLLGRVRRLFHRDVDPGSLSSGSVALGVVLVVGVLAIAAIAGNRVTSAPKSEDDAFEGPVADETSWPQLGGSAAHNPISPVTNLPTQFHLDRLENIRWSQPIGDFAFSSPVVSGGKVLIGTNNAIGRDPRFPKTSDVTGLQCFDEVTGAFLWQYSSPRIQGLERDWPLLRICLVPVVEGDRVWLVTNRCEVVCLDLNGHRDNEDDGLPEPEASAPGAESADVVWRYDLVSTLGVRPQKAASVTPTIAGNLLLLNSPSDVDESDQKPATPGAPAFLAIDKMTGELVWSDNTPTSNIHCYGCSGGVPIAPAAALIDGTWQAIFAGYDGWLYAYDLEAIQRGETQLLWKFDLNPKAAKLWRERGIANTPVVVGHRVYAAVGNNTDDVGDQGRLWCIDATKRGDLSSDLVYNKSAPDVVIPHKEVAVEPDKGDFTRPNPHSGVVWVYTSDDLNQNGKIEHDEQMHLSNSLPAIHDGLLIATDLNGYVHCLDAATGKLLWSHDLFAASPCGPLIADGKAWIIDEDGELTIFALARQKQILAEHKVEKSGHANLAAANQTLYLATKTQLVAIGSGEFPKPNGVTAKLPGGLEIELVGVTPNSAPTAEGWRPNGSPIEGAGGWPRGAMFSRDGDRFTMTTDSSSKLTPDPLARDVLFECRGAASSPSWTITRQGGWTEFQALNVEAGLRRRLSMQRKKELLNTTIEMAYTDSPWGPWQRIGADGKRINTIETFGPDQQLYRDIRIERIGSSPNQNEKGRPLELVLNEPATGNDYHSGVFAIDVRLIGKNQKVLPTYPQPQPMKEGRRTVTWRTVETVPLESLQYAEFRLRPYRHFITFENVPLEKSATGRVAVKHRSIAEPPRRTPDDRFVARLSDGLEIELLRIVRNDLPIEKSWLPNGEAPLSVFDWPNRENYLVTENSFSTSAEGPGSDRVWDIAYAYRHISSNPLISIDIGNGYSGSSTSLGQIGLRTMALAPRDPSQLTKLQMRVGSEPWGEWIQVGADGEILNPTVLSDRPDSPEKLLTLAGAGLDESNLDRCWIKWLALPNAQQLYSMEVRAIDDDGIIHQARNQEHKITNRPLHELTHWFNLTVDKLARFEYRLRPYRHLVTFDQICTDPAKPTEVRVSVDPIVFLEVFPSPEAAVKPTRPLVAKLPGGLEVELVGVAKNFAPSKEGWKPDGSPIGEVADWKATRVFRRVGDSTVFDSKGTPHPDARDYLFEMRGFRSPPSNETNLNDTTSWNEPEYAEPYRTRLSMLLKESNDAKKFSVKITDDPWGPYQQVGPDGALLNELNLTELEKKYYDKIRVEHCGPDPANPGEGELSLQFQGSFMLDEKDWGYAFEVRAIGLDGQPLKDAYPWNSSRILNRTTLQYLTSDHLPADKIARWEYRLRPYRHFITFENVSFEPGKKTEPKVSVESIEVAKAQEEPVAQPPTPEVPKQPRIDLIGLTYDTVPKKETWQTNGQPLPAPEWVQQLPKLYDDDKGKPAPLYLFEVHGLRGKPSFRHRYQPAVVSGDDEVPEGRPYRMAVLYEDLKPEERNQFIIWGEHPAVRVSDEPWGPWRTITKQGQFAGELDSATLYREGYELVTAHGIRPLTRQKNDPKPTSAVAQSALVLTYPRDYDSFYAIELEGVSFDSAQPNVRLTNRMTASFQTEQKNGWFVVDECPVDLAKLDHIRFRIRPYRHRFEFQEVADKPNAKTPTSAPFKVIYRKVEHDLPKPVRPAQAQSQTISLPRLPIESYAQAGVPRDKLAEVDKKRLASAPWGDVQEPSESESRKSPLVLGLRIASDADWWIGGQVKGELTVRNTSAENVLFKRAPRSDIGLSVVAIDSDGQEHPADFAHFEGWPVLSPILLPPGHIMTVKEFTLHFGSQKDVSGYYPGLLPLPPGDYTLKCRWHDARPEVAHEGEWTGELTSVAHQFQLAAADEPAAQRPAPEIVPPRVELVGLTYDKDSKTDAWQTNGQPMKLPEWVQSIPRLHNDDKGLTSLLFLYEVYGLRAKPSFHHNHRTAVVSGDIEPSEGRPYRMAVLFEDLKPGIYPDSWCEYPAVRATDEPWGPWRTITKEGQFAAALDPNTLYPEGYELMTAHGIRPLTKLQNDPEPAADAVRTGLVLKYHQEYDSLYAMEIEAVPTSPEQPNVRLTGRRILRFQNEAKKRWDFETEWPVDPEKINHIRYRIRPYRHQYVFESVAFSPSQKPDKSTPCKAVYMKLEHDLPKPAGVSRVQATLPGGLELELLGVTPYREPGIENWTPYGRKFEPAPEWASRLKVATMPLNGIDYSDLNNEVHRDFIVRVRGFTKEQPALLPFTGPTIESGDSTIGPMSVLTWNQQVQRLRIGIPGEWGPYRVLTVDPKVLSKAKAVEAPAEVPAPFRKVYDSIQPVIEEGQARGFAAFDQFPFGEVNLNQGDYKGQHTRVVWKGQPANPDLKYTTIEAVLIDVAGKRHASTGTTYSEDGNSQCDADLFDVPFDQVSHVEYRLRPYQHVVTFNNVALKPGVACGPNVVVESPLDEAKNAKATPPLEFRLVAAAAVKEPVEFTGQRWFRIVGEAAPDSAGKPVVDKSALGLPVERLNASNESMGLVGDTPVTSMPWDGTWHVEKCEVQPDPNGEELYVISVTLDSLGGKALRALTTGALRQRLAVIVEDRILVAPTIMDAIGTKFVITGAYTKEQAERFAKSIQRGGTVDGEITSE